MRHKILAIAPMALTALLISAPARAQEQNLVTAAMMGVDQQASAQSAAAEGESQLSPELMQQVAAKIEADNARQVETFKDLHGHPELGFMEMRTAGVLARELEALGFDVQTGIGKTGVVATLTNGSGLTVMYRADMGANAVEEATGLPYAGKVRAKRADGTESPGADVRP